MRIKINADDYGITPEQSAMILECSHKGALTGISIMPNTPFLSGAVRLWMEEENRPELSIHLNLTEGRPCLPPEQVPLLVNTRGFFCRNFANLLFCLYLPGRKKLLAQIQAELTEQIRTVCRKLPENFRFCLDGHQHIQMIPPLCRKILDAAVTFPGFADMRISCEFFMPFFRHPEILASLKFRNIIKAARLHLLTPAVSRLCRRHGISPHNRSFFGILLTGKMDLPRLKKLMPEALQHAEHKGFSEMEIMFHPGWIPGREFCLDPDAEEFTAFNTSPDRLEADRKSLMELKTSLESLFNNSVK